MENKIPQKELFEFEQPKKISRPRFSNFFTRSDFYMAFTAEKIVFISIGIIMLMVVFFALGVEKGKTIAAKNTVVALPAQTAAVPLTVKPAAAAAVQAKAVTATNITSKAKVAQPILVQQHLQAQGPADKPYTIVAAAFLKQDFASKEVAILKAASFDAFVIKSEPYYLACVGSFANKDSAQKVLSKVRQMHRDAYIRLR